MGPKGVVGLAGALIVVLLVLSSVYIIPETHRGVLLRFGELVETDIQAGIHFKVPVIDQVREFDIRGLTIRRVAKIQHNQIRPNTFTAQLRGNHQFRFADVLAEKSPGK